MMVVLWRIRVASGTAAAPAAPDEVLRQPSAGDRESLGEVSP